MNCSEKGCLRPVHAHGRCNACYQRLHYSKNKKKAQTFKKPQGCDGGGTEQVQKFICSTWSKKVRWGI